METFLKKIKLVEKFSVNVPFERKDFIKRMRIRVAPGSTNFFSDAFGNLSPDIRKYKGFVGEHEFKLRHRPGLFQLSKGKAVAHATFEQHGDMLRLLITVRGLNAILILLLVFACIPILSAIISIFSSDDIFAALISSFFTLIVVAVVVGIQYFMLRNSVKSLKGELQVELPTLSK